MRIQFGKLALTGVAAIALGIAGPAFTADKLNRVLEFRNGTQALDIDTYLAPTDQKLGIFWFKDGADERQIFLYMPQWLRLKDLIEKAMDGEGAPWRKIGDVEEAGMKDPSSVSVLSGPDRIRFTIDSPSQKSVTYELKPSDEFEFVGAVTEVKHWLLTD